MMVATSLLLGAAASLATAAGGTLALRFRNQLRLIVAIAAGIVLGVAAFDLLPEAVELGASLVGGRQLSAAAAIGLCSYMLLHRGAGVPEAGPADWRAHLVPATLTLHSLVDGLGIGLAFQAGTGIGWVVAVAVLSHDIVDGVNIVSLTLATRNARTARRWLAANSAAPLLGAASGMLLPVSPGMLALILAAFGGAFVFISVGELLPRSYNLDPRPRTTAASLVGLVLMAAATGLAR